MVTGATGLTGSHTVRALLDAGHRVRAFIRGPEKARRVFGRQACQLELAVGDIADRTSVQQAVEGCDALIHCAAVVAVGKPGDPEALLEANVGGVQNVLGAAVECGVSRIVHVSSLATLFRGDGSTLTESSKPRDSEHPYGQSKVVADRYARSLQAEGHPVKIVYPGAIIGPDDPGLTESMNALRAFVQDFIPITTGGMQLVDARDLAVAQARIVEAAPGPARYLAAGTFLSWPQLAETLEQAAGRSLRAIRVPAPALRVTGRVLDLARRVVPIELPLTAEAAAYITRWDSVPNSKTLIDMGVTFRDVGQSIADAVHWLEAAGHLEVRKH